MEMTREIIPKDCLLCDTCNKALTDGDFVATDDSTWYEGWLYCKECEDKYKPSMKIILKIEKYDNLSDTDLAKPMVFDSW